MDFRDGYLRLTAAVILGITAPGIAQFDFQPQATFTGSSLTGWHTLGQANWKAENGELVGTPKPGGSGGWLVLDKSFQDIRVFADFRCTGACNAGILTRVEKTPDGGMHGLFMSLAPGDLGLYSLTLDAEGREIKREKLPPAPPEFGAPARPAAAVRTAAPTGAASRRPPGVLPRKPAELLPAGEWNDVSVLTNDEAIQASINKGAIPELGTDDHGDGYGQIAFYAGGTGEAHFKSVGWKDINAIVRPKEITSSHFTKLKISDFYYGWDAQAADINHDGTVDIVSGPFYYVGPDFTERRRYREGRTYNPSSEYAPDMINFSYDFTGDGWPDILASDEVAGQRPVDLYVNPKGESRRWEKHRAVTNISTELVLLKDIDGDGKPELIFGGAGVYAYAKPDPSNPTAEWIVHPISEPVGRVNNHGLGVGDINGDGRMDLIVPSGWYEQPAKGSEQKTWTFHATSFGGGGGEMGIYDVNGDGLMDVVTSLEAHGFGLAWYEQKRDKDGQISFVEHQIEGDYSTSAKNAGGVTFSQPHGSRFADLDGDGIPDFIVGKSFFHHLETYGDPDVYGPPVLYVYRTVRNPKAPGGAEFVPELIDNHSGVGSAFEVMDINKDGALDIVTQTGLGTFVFYGKHDKWAKPVLQNK